MKSAYKFLLAAFAATVALASCTKDIAADRQDTDPQDGLRKIAISFGTPTKTVLGDGLTPTFTEGDEIIVSDESGDCAKVTVELYKNSKGGTEAYFRTSLKGSLYAVYPARAAILKDDKLSVVKFNILPNQTGLFEDANIAVGKSTGEDQMKFNNASAILKFYVGPEVGVNSLVITAQDTSGNTDWKLTEAGSINVDLSSGSKFRKAPENEGRVCYVAVPPISSTVIMIVDSYTDAQTSSPDTPVRRVFRGNTVKVNQMVNVFIPYYITVNDQKWAYCNVGAFLPEESGYYFSWGNRFGCYYDDGWVTAEGKSEYSFTEVAYKPSSGGQLSTDIPATEKADPARYAWGDGWRMPKAEECEILKKSLEGKVTWFSKNDGHGQLFYGSRGLYVDDRIFFPATGFAFENSLKSFTDTGYYWTSTKGKYSFEVKEGSPYLDLKSDETVKHLGYLIRPIYDETMSGDDAVGLQISPYTDGKTL